MTNARTANIVLAIGGLNGFVSTEVQNSPSVLRLKFSVKNPARHQETIEDKLLWDETALNLALKINNDNVRGVLSPLYLNIAKCYEDLRDFDNARKNYENALPYTSLLPENGYGNMIKGGIIMNGLERVKLK